MMSLKCKHRCLAYFKRMYKTSYLEEERERRRRKMDHEEGTVKRARQTGVPNAYVCHGHWVLGLPLTSITFIPSCVPLDELLNFSLLLSLKL